MAVPQKLVVAPSAATRELWRVAENGELDELAGLLPRADINARNEHGMTALMRAANHGHVRMVRALLEHGADPNATRNDNFTALSLAAFFGHSEIVEMLIGYGARTDVATRYGTSAHMWAKARSYGDVAQCLQQRKEEIVQPKPTPTAMPTPPVMPPTPPPRQRVFEPDVEVEQEGVRTLSEPPEIWDLVHEAPRDFSAGSAFIARVGSITAGVALGIVAFLVVAGGIAGVWYWKQTRPPQAISVAPQPPPATITTPIADPTNAAPIRVPDPVVQQSAPRRSLAKPRVTQIPQESAAVVVPPPPVAPKVELRATTSAAAPTKPAAPPPPQMISTPKPQQPKAKVIQWP